MKKAIASIRRRIFLASAASLILIINCGAQSAPNAHSDAVVSLPASKDKVTKPTAPSQNLSANAVPADADFVIGPDDVLGINVWREPEMSRSVPVRPDGKISLPLLGEFEASGLTPRQLQAKLAKQLATLVSNPEVTVIVEQIKSQKFNIVGEVGHPGSFPLSKPMTVLDAVAVAGGLKDFAKPKKMYVLRRNRDGSTERIAFNYKKAIQGSTNQNFDLQERDTIVVP